MNFFNRFSKFHKIYFLVFFTFNIILFVGNIYNTTPMSSALTPLSIVALISTLTGIFAAIYTARGEVAAYVWGFFNVVSYIFVSYSRHFYGEVILYTLYMLPMQFVGYYTWYKSAKESKSGHVEAKRMTVKTWGIFVILFIIIWGLYATFVYHLPNILYLTSGIIIPPDKTFLIDSLTATLTISAVILATNRFVEQWYMWIISDSIGIVLFIISIIESGSITMSAISGAMMWIQFTTNAIYGYYVWRRLNKKQ